VDDGPAGGGCQAILDGMAICLLCDREMLTAPSCTVSVLHLDGRHVAVVPYGLETRYGRFPTTRRRCDDCGVEPGGFHHLGCDWAECPHCRGQLFSCGCPFDEFPDDFADEDEELEGWL
jgi:hypothetical protein